MKRASIAGLGAIAIIAAVPFVSTIPGFTALHDIGEAIAQTINPAKVDLRLTADKQVVEKDQQGKENVTWQALQGNVVVQPGNVIRYRVLGENSSDRPVKKLSITQPVPKQTIYVLNSAMTTQNSGVNTVYSIDNAKTFVEKPTVQVKLPNGEVETKPAPAEAYTHVRWSFSEPIAAQTKVAAAYQVKVR
ncbi:MAG: hypothetical protein KME08_07925 [Aphanothece sp. CMT-3BRIN-NPC111]|jgi:uncharacterized repeat protein (TIGR01451 family)|nr:hypothetical protein [Aphanothece sp. CMT-3BRIN-NPC111]